MNRGRGEVYNKRVLYSRNGGLLQEAKHCRKIDPKLFLGPRAGVSHLVQGKGVIPSRPQINTAQSFRRVTVA